MIRSRSLSRLFLAPIATALISFGCRAASDGHVGHVSSDDAAADMTWEDALEKMSSGASGQYSYVLFYPQDSSGLAYGTRLRIGLADGNAECPTPQDAEAASGWWLDIVTNGLTAGEYSYEWSRSHALGQIATGKFDVSFAWRGLNGSVKRYQVISGTAKLNVSLVEMRSADNAQPISGRLVLTLPTPSIWEVECREAFSLDAGLVNLGCDCLVGDQEVQSCVPDSPDEVCCASVATNPVEWIIPFEARPCASLCTSTDFAARGLCDDLQQSDFENW